MNTNTQNHGRIENLVPIDSRPPEEARAIHAAGGRAAAAARVRNRTLNEAVMAVMSRPISSEELCMEDDLEEGATRRERVALSLVRHAEGGDMKAVALIMEMERETPPV